MLQIMKNRIIQNGILIPIDLAHTADEKAIPVTEDYIDINYASRATPARVLSNLYPYHFNYFGNPVKSIEAAIQSLKFCDPEVRQACYDYAGVDAYHAGGIDRHGWQKEGILYTPTRQVNRFAEEYQEFLDELYFMAFQNPLYRNNLRYSGNKKLDHTIGDNNPACTTLTRTEYITRLYALRHCIEQQIFQKDEAIMVLRKVRTELK